ncbi:class I SAM-dependent methyltransferase [Chitinophaga ginsengisegetis]|uniref:class I SAM-dependent methyltransferase n=1 Tax=Chitinophaga ginsengisegetis TaxID=393003 RepID=UPI000DBF4C5A|nr:class I SAM-dependent methyltransferase [Chitinophaga ginsengisegetis]MDR6567332.1 O-methyltransferase involved in polyketide biosynthesis [Chitinophaga ginsengisegetis]MDR6647063.1 O-methyltransferase involved in polyketide biosynthesis [Chitinophaga ginsengisegetis]MDR6653412.1 O-methyltransferase involved in polyketide biosynthesis [Chitinophaga ginsengisegetis]
MTEKLKVPSTSRLVLEAAMQLYITPLQQQYIEAIDFSETSGFYDELKQQYPFIADMICLRKQSIRRMLRERMPAFPGQQVIMLGAGLDPLSLYLLENYPQQISRIIEVDNGYIEEKQQLYEEIMPGNPLIRFIKCNITDTALLWSKLLENGYREEIPAIIVFEGVLHYISNDAFVQVMQLFKTPQQHNLVLLDYSLSEEEVPARFLSYHKAVKEVLENYIGRPVNVNNRADIAGLLYQLDGILDTVEPLCETEKKLTGDNHLFHAPGEGIVEMVSFRI